MRGVWHSVRELFCSLNEGPRLAREPGVPDASAHEQSLQLLVRNLSPAQREQFARHRYFEVVGSESGARYRIRYGRALNVERLDANGSRVLALCFVPHGNLSVGDIMLAQKVALELFESKALRVANASPTWELGRELLWPDRRIGGHPAPLRRHCRLPILR
jgi:hypothetical protein